MRARNILVVMLVLVWAGAAKADFNLTGTDHLDVVSSHAFGTLWGSSTADIQVGGSVSVLNAYNTSGVVVSGGGVSILRAHNTCTVQVSSGSVGDLGALDTSIVHIFGGSVVDLGALDTSNVTLHGYDFQATGGLSLAGDTVLGTGTLAGKWFDGTPWTIPITSHAAGATILAIPEPATLALLALGGLAMLRRKRR